MITKKVIIGFPIQLMTRILNVGGASGIAGKLISGAVVAGAAGVTAYNIAQSIVPSVGTTLGKDANKPAQDLGAVIGTAVEALITFMDLNANMLKISEKRRLARVDVPGREGDFIQNLGAKSVDYRLTGKFFPVDPKATSQSPFSDIFYATFKNVAVGNTQLLRLLMRTGVPAPFLCEYEISEVIIANVDFNVTEPTSVDYTIDLIEYRRLPQLLKMGTLAGLGLFG